MLVLHAHWQPPAPPSTRGVLLFWAETSDAPQPSRQSLRTRKARAHPFAATARTVHSLLERLAAPTGLLSVIDAAYSLALYLPTAKVGRSRRLR
jgi:hypothetical protein